MTNPILENITNDVTGECISYLKIGYLFPDENFWAYADGSLLYTRIPAMNLSSADKEVLMYIKTKAFFSLEQ